jgi:hypothetical protein
MFHKAMYPVIYSKEYFTFLIFQLSFCSLYQKAEFPIVANISFSLLFFQTLIIIFFPAKSFLNLVLRLPFGLIQSLRTCQIPMIYKQITLFICGNRTRCFGNFGFVSNISVKICFQRARSMFRIYRISSNIDHC